MKCKRKAELNERHRKRKEHYNTWYAGLTVEEKAFWDSIPELELD
ncbi:MAG: hypothetical protein ABIJ52_03360 [Pseudomonadota bacterium]